MVMPSSRAGRPAGSIGHGGAGEQNAIPRGRWTDYIVIAEPEQDPVRPEGTNMKLTERRIPDEFVRAIPRGFRLVKRQGHDFLLVESLFCRNGHNLVVDSVRIHDEASVKLKVNVGAESGFVFIDAFWGSHAKLFSFIPKGYGGGQAFAEPFCPYCDVPLSEDYPCTQRGCGSGKSVRLSLPGGKNTIPLAS